MSRILQDLRYAARGLIKTHLFTAGVIITLALGIGSAALGLVVLTLAVVAALAAYLPARRASRVAPMVALRSE